MGDNVYTAIHKLLDPFPVIFYPINTVDLEKLSHF
ncbi:hypothetical protein AsAng_0009840 [Aureispira anguillae]|uniref:Uncharacterized protein n=1 Tax=Aureispira anguillae TaxID=2864201 RepID=A0A915YC04_9BACT|nr:hypothetical protein AsAng_0009840 [Aureispira anguillae]